MRTRAWPVVLRDHPDGNLIFVGTWYGVAVRAPGQSWRHYDYHGRPWTPGLPAARRQARTVTRRKAKGHR